VPELRLRLLERGRSDHQHHKLRHLVLGHLRLRHRRGVDEVLVLRSSGYYYELGPFPGTLSYGAGYDTLSFYGPSNFGSLYEGSFTLSP
jgi:hypothetical protein